VSAGSIGARLANLLVRSGKIAASDVDKTRQLADEGRQSFGTVLARTGLVADRDVASAYAQLLDSPLLSDDEIPLVPFSEQAYKESFLREAKILPLAIESDSVRVATADPENRFALKALAMSAGRPLALTIGTSAQIDRGLDLWFGVNVATSDTLEGDDGGSYEESEAIDRLRDLASEAPVIRLVNLIVQRAIERRASDIHVEPFHGELRVRYRIDGVLQDVESPPPRSSAAVVSRIKLMAKMDIAERRLPQDGRVHIRVQGALIDLRVSTVPTLDAGESVVLRILDQERAALDLHALGFDPHMRAALEAQLESPHGIILVTGPTGSGKTTTLYALLERLNSSDRKILTIEDPVEYQIEGINQIQVKPQIGLDFPQALRSIVRQDPDVIMVGEMRDLETARIAVQSALTGHLVFSTLHTNDAGSSITRLLDMGVEDYLVTSSVNAIVAQRLVRRLCPACRTAYRPAPGLAERLGLGAPAAGEAIELFAARGCPACDGTGYHGRTVIAEVLVLSDAVRRAVLDRADGKALERLAVGEGMRTMHADGVRKALAGTTTVEEVTRVAIG
jgi:general secretion pathway protein E